MHILKFFSHCSPPPPRHRRGGGGERGDPREVSRCGSGPGADAPGYCTAAPFGGSERLPDCPGADAPGYCTAAPFGGSAPLPGQALTYRLGDGRGFLVTTRYASAPSVISMDWSAARPRKVWVVLLVGQVTVRQSTESASRRPINSTRLLP